jgi:hypothetical protein
VIVVPHTRVLGKHYKQLMCRTAMSS